MKPTILYVDDEDVNLFLFSHTMDEHYNVLTAVSGPEGLNVLDQNSNNVVAVISDMRMPHMDGLDFIEKAKAKYESLFYFILTGYSFNEQIEKAVETGLIDNSFTKPFDVDELSGAINELMSQNGK
jgi:response regulator RpfG family c-di-GMP phosphodiesterase